MASREEAAPAEVVEPRKRDRGEDEAKKTQGAEKADAPMKDGHDGKRARLAENGAPPASPKPRARGAAAAAEGEAPADASDPVVLKMVIPNADAGRIIGKQGSVLKQIMEVSGARVRLSATEEVLPSTGERIITCIGTLATVGAAQQIISAALNDPRPGEAPAEEPRPLKVLPRQLGRGTNLLGLSLPRHVWAAALESWPPTARRCDTRRIL